MQFPMWYKQAGFRFTDSERVVYIDPWDVPAGEALADFILITHAHYDHFDPQSIHRLRKPSTIVVAPRDVAQKLGGANVFGVQPNERRTIEGLAIETIPAYNIGKEFHPLANGWVGYIITIHGKRFYHAGDTDHIPEMAEVEADVAMLPIGGTYTMNAEEAADAAKVIQPDLAIPMHYGFVVGSQKDGERFRDLAAPISVELLTPRISFTQ